MCYKILPSLTILFMVFGLSCQKSISFLLPEAPGPSVNAFFKKNTAEAMQAFSFNANTGGQFTGKKGTRVMFKPNAFTDRNGNRINGNIKLHLVEVLTPADMILNNKVTISNGLPIQSGGAFYINATFNSGKDTAVLAAGELVKFTLSTPSAAAPGMQVFTGEVYDSSGSITWFPDTTQGNTVQRTTSTSGRDSVTIVNMFCNTMEWVNCDRFMNEPNIRFTIEPGDAPDADSTMVFIHFTGRNAVMPVYQDPGNNNFSSAGLIAAPVTIIGICMVNKAIYTAIGTATLTNNGSYTMKFTATTEEELKARLQLLR